MPAQLPQHHSRSLPTPYSHSAHSARLPPAEAEAHADGYSSPLYSSADPVRARAPGCWEELPLLLLLALLVLLETRWSLKAAPGFHPAYGEGPEAGRCRT